MTMDPNHELQQPLNNKSTELLNIDLPQDEQAAAQHSGKDTHVDHEQKEHGDHEQKEHADPATVPQHLHLQLQKDTSKTQKLSKSGNNNSEAELSRRDRNSRRQI